MTTVSPAKHTVAKFPLHSHFFSLTHDVFRVKMLQKGLPWWRSG